MTKLAQYFSLSLASAVLLLAPLAAKTAPRPRWDHPAVLDPTLAIQHPLLESKIHHPLPEQFLQFPAPPSRHAESQAVVFRARFTVTSVPSHATLYLTGMDRAQVWLNGRFAGARRKLPTNARRDVVFVLNMDGYLRPGANVLALRVRGGQRRLAAKLVPALRAVNATPLLISDRHWKCNLAPGPGWQRLKFSDAAWPVAHSLGGIESHIDFLQWNQDAAMYQWPGYDGISPFLAHYTATARRVMRVYAGNGKFENARALIANSGVFTVVTQARPAAAQPSLVLDFGREIAGRVRLVSTSAFPFAVVTQYGESLGEALHHPYLGPARVLIPPRATVYGPKSAFRYVYLRFPPAAAPERLAAINVDGIYYPVRQRGAFVSSDPMLNRIWQVGVYTAHLCMQDDIWDAPKRDRGRWMGDLDVSGRVIDSVFADRFLVRDTMNRLIAAAGDPVHHDVNGIPGYSAFWIMGEADFYRHFADRAYLEKIHPQLLQLVRYMETEMNPAGMFVNAHHAWPFVDWSPRLNGDTRATRIGTEIEFYRAFHDAVWMLDQLGDRGHAQQLRRELRRMRGYIRHHLVRHGTFGPRRQINAMAVLAGLAGPRQRRAIWKHVLSRPLHFRITPYYNAYVIDAMARLGHRRFALRYLRHYWGGMIREGATSFWEAYDPRWPKSHPHRRLKADGGQGYFVSLAHGWSTGPSYWLIEQLLGIRTLTPGFARVAIHPDLAGLAWARGAEPTPHGLIRVRYRAEGAGLSATVTLPHGVVARVSLPVSSPSARIELNGHPIASALSSHGRRRIILLRWPGAWSLQSH